MGGLFGGDDDDYGCEESYEPVARAASKSYALKKEEEEEEDVDMGGFFGGDDDDYGCEDPTPIIVQPKPIKHEETKSVPAKSAIMKPTDTPKPEFNNFIAGVTTMGSWSANSRALLAACLEGDQFDDLTVREAISAITLADGTDIETVYMTLLAWYILEEGFGDEEDQWQLIVSKAKTWLESAGVPKPASFVAKFSLAIKQ